MAFMSTYRVSRKALQCEPVISSPSDGAALFHDYNFENKALALSFPQSSWHARRLSSPFIKTAIGGAVMLTLGDHSGIWSLQIRHILIAKTGLPWENLTSLLGKTSCISWQDLPLFAWAIPIHKFTHSPHYTQAYTHEKNGREGRRTGLVPPTLLCFPRHCAHMVSTHHGLQKLSKLPFCCRESLEVRGRLTVLLWWRLFGCPVSKATSPSQHFFFGKTWFLEYWTHRGLP